MEIDRLTLRHILATHMFRFKHVTEDVPDDFGDFTPGEEVRTPSETVRHMSGMMLFIHHRFVEFELEALPAQPWDEECRRFLDMTGLVDDDLAKDRPLRLIELSFAQLLQGPVIDVATHIGQLATLRRLAGSPVPRISYMVAEIAVEDVP